MQLTVSCTTNIDYAVNHFMYSIQGYRHECDSRSYTDFIAKKAITTFIYPTPGTFQISRIFRTFTNTLTISSLYNYHLLALITTMATPQGTKSRSAKSIPNLSKGSNPDEKSGPNIDYVAGMNELVNIQNEMIKVTFKGFNQILARYKDDSERNDDDSCLEYLKNALISLTNDAIMTAGHLAYRSGHHTYDETLVDEM